MDQCAGSLLYTVGPSSPFDQLPDDLVVGILVCAARDAYADDAVSHFGCLDKLCQLRLVCSRFDRIITQAEYVTWTLSHEGEIKLEAVRFIKGCENLRSLHIDGGYGSTRYSISDDFMVAISGATPSLEYFGVSGGRLCKDIQSAPPDWQTHELFRTLSLCPQLRSLSLERCVAKIHRPLSLRYPLASLIKVDLINVEVMDMGLASIFLASPVLEKFALDNVNGLQDPMIASKTLTSLTFHPGQSLGILKVETPNLNHLEVSTILRLLVAAPKLHTLMLSRVSNLVKEAPWEVDTLEVEDVATKENLVEFFLSCMDARVVRLKENVFSANAFSGGVGLSQLVQPFRELRELEVAHDLSRFILIEKDVSLLRTSLASLRSLKVGFHQISEEVDLCLELAKVAPKLDTITIDLENTCQGRVETAVMRFLKLQKQYPQLDTQISWPANFDFRHGFDQAYD